MKKILVLSAILLSFAVACLADPVAVFDVQWGKGKERQTRTFAIGFYDADAPQTTANFKKLVTDGFYKKTTIHRVFPNYLVQGGDPLSRRKDRTVVGTGGPGYTLPAEIRRKHLRGSVAMGRLPNNVNPNRQSNGSQFLSAFNPSLPRTARIPSLVKWSPGYRHWMKSAIYKSILTTIRSNAWRSPARTSSIDPSLGIR